MFRLCSQVAIGKYALSGGVNEVTVRRSVHEIVDTATIKLPAIGRVNSYLGNNLILGNFGLLPKTSDLPVSSIETSKLFSEGDKVNILLGYNNTLKREFTGFVRRVNASTPVLIECEGYAWQLRRKYLNKSWKSIALKEFLKELVADTDIKISPIVPNVQLSNVCGGKYPNCLNLLDKVRQQNHLSAFFQFDTLYVGIEEGVPGKTINYRLGWNTVRDDQLKYRSADDTKVLIKLYGRNHEHKQLLAEAGDKNGTIVNERVANIRYFGDLKKLAEKLLTLYKYNGYEGNIIGFLQPYAQPSDVANILDRQYNERGGKFFIDGIEVTFGMDGGRRKVHISRSVTGNTNGSDNNT